MSHNPDMLLQTKAIVFKSGNCDCHDSVDFTCPESLENVYDFLISHYSTNCNKQEQAAPSSRRMVFGRESENRLF